MSGQLSWRFAFIVACSAACGGHGGKEAPESTQAEAPARTSTESAASETSNAHAPSAGAGDAQVVASQDAGAPVGGRVATMAAAGAGGAGGQPHAADPTSSTSVKDSDQVPTLPDNGCDVRLSDQPQGFAAQDGGTVGGGNAAPIRVSSEAELKKYLADDEPRVLYIMQDLDFRTPVRDGVRVCVDNQSCDNGSGKQVDEPRVADSCSSDEHSSTNTRNETTLHVGSNKTVIGIGSGKGAAVRGASFNIGASSQVIFRNLRVYDVNPQLVEAGDGFTLQGSRHVWLDHLLLEQISDGLVDIGSADHDKLDKNVTLSFIHFDGRTAYQCGGKHHFVDAVDNSEVTYHHNWYDNCSGRNPKVGQPGSRVHLYNNYWKGVSYFCITAQTDSQVRVESNFFEDSLKPHWLQKDGNGTAGIAIDDGNEYTGSSSGNTSRDVGGSVFSVPYPYEKQTAAEAKAAIVKCAGPQPIR